MNSPELDQLRNELEDLKKRKDLPMILETKKRIEYELDLNERLIRSREGSMEEYVNHSVFLIKSLILVRRCQRDVRSLLESCG